MLSSNNLKGSIPTEIYNLKSLSTLSLNKNEISISFAGIGNALNLRAVDVSATGLSSLTGISNALSLVDLHLEQNSFAGPIPTELYNVPKLEQLRLDYNKLTGTIDAKFGRLKNLKVFSADNNNLSGVLPDAMAFCAMLNNLVSTTQCCYVFIE